MSLVSSGSRPRPDQRRRGAVAIALVAGADVGEDVVEMDVEAHAPQFVEAAAGAHLGAGGDEQFRVGLGRDHGADVAAVEDGAALLVAKRRWRSSRASRTKG